MRSNKLADLLCKTANPAERRAALIKNEGLVDLHLAEQLRDICIESFSVDPAKVSSSAAALKSIADYRNDAAITANADWANGIERITQGKFEAAVKLLEQAAASFQSLELDKDAAFVQVSLLLALAMLSRYDEAIQTGLSALPILEKHGEELAAGKIEMNLSNIVSRRSLHREAYQYCSSARERFNKAGEPTWQAMAENGLANTYAEQNEFSFAESYYQMALDTARSARMLVTEAEIEASLGNLAILRGYYGDALKHLESSRRKFESLDMPHQTAIAELETANAYAELNLHSEAIEIYGRVCNDFRRYKLRGEESRARLNYGRTAMALGQNRLAASELGKALKLFILEKNVSGQAAAMVAQAESALRSDDFTKAISIAKSTRSVLRQTENARLALSIGLIEGEAHLLGGRAAKAKTIFENVRSESERLQQPSSLQAVLNSMGRAEQALSDHEKAASYFRQSIALVETMRQPLSYEGFKIAFMAGRLEPYENLTRHFLRQNEITNAFETLEMSRSRSLADELADPWNDPEIKITCPGMGDGELIHVREELNGLYKRSELANERETMLLKPKIEKAESRIRRIFRDRGSMGTFGDPDEDEPTQFSFKTLNKQLGRDRTLIEFVEFDGVFSAFVVSGSGIKYVPGLASVGEIENDLEDLHFQFGALRYGGETGRFAESLRSRADICLRRIYDRILRPLESYIKGNSLIVVPAGALHYVPFPALHDGERYIVERFEFVQAPSASVWSLLNKRRRRPIKRSLVVGFADAQNPAVDREIKVVSQIVPEPVVLFGANASMSSYERHASDCGLIHLACHGQFRSDSPMFSSLHLADGWVTVLDICEQDLTAELVTLSACETGLSFVHAGEELIGLTSGFLSAGASSLIVSLWTVDDAATTDLMHDLYKEMQRGSDISSSLRTAQLNAINAGRHPYLWSPFVLIGR